MFKRFRSKEFLTGVIFTLILVSTINVFAAGSIKKQIDVLYNEIKLVVDGKSIVFGKDTTGKQIEPFIYNGTTYLPVRAVGEALDKEVDWDGSTQTVYVGKKPGEISYLTETVEPYSYSNGIIDKVKIIKLEDKEKLNMGGIQYNTGFKFGEQRYATGVQASFNLNGQYEEIKGTLGALAWNNIDHNQTFNIYLDNKLYKSIEVKNKELPKEIIIPVKGVLHLMFEIPKRTYIGAEFTTLGLGDPTIK